MMMKRLSGAAWLLLLTAPGLRAQSLAERFPADAIVYVEADTTRFVDGALGIDLVKLLDEPQVHEFLKPLGGMAPAIDGEGLRRLIDSVPWRQFVNGKVEIALRGLHVDLDGQGFDVSPAQPFTARTLNRLIGAASRYADGGEPTVELAIDFVAALDVGDGFDSFFNEHLKGLSHVGMNATTEPCKVLGRDALKIRVAGHGDEPNESALLVKEGKRWWFGGSQATLEHCLGGGTKECLAAAPAWRAFQGQVTGGDPAILAYFNVANVARIFERCIPPLVKEEFDLFGISSIESAGYASSFVEGGVRDTFAVAYNSKPTGLLSLLDCCDGGFNFLKVAPVETGLYFGARVDLEAFVDKFAKVTEELFPGSGAAFEKGLGQANREIGMDVRQELLAALGNEIGIYLTSPGGGAMIPDGLVMVKVGDRQQFEKLLARGIDEATKGGQVSFSEMKGLPEGAKGWTATIEQAPVQPAFALTNDTFCIAKDPLALKKALRDLQGGAKSCAADNENLQRGLNGAVGAKSADRLSLLLFGDLRRAVEIGYGFVPMVAGEMKRATGGKLDPAALPDAEVISRHFSSIVIAGRSDERGLMLSAFTPCGIPALVAGAALAAQHHMREPLASSVTTSEIATPKPAPRSNRRASAGKETPREPKVETPATTTPSKDSKGAKSRSLADLFSGIEKATGATIDFPETLGQKQVSFTPRSGDLETILKDLSAVAGFKFEVKEVDGEKLVIVTGD